MIEAMEDEAEPTPVADAEHLATPPRLEHQRALDGLRGLAIIAVMVYHSNSGNVAWAPGGFIGVDLFFVLSGFLITSLLLIEHGNGRGVVTLDFWRRRARRLLPPVFVALLLVAAYAAFYARSYEINSYRMSAIAMLFYFQNYYQIYSHNRIRSPLSQTWSLSVEEQFYIVWPFALYFVLRATRGRTKRVIATLLVVSIASAVLMSVRYSRLDPFAVYNATQTRVQALLLGAALAAAILRWKGPATRAAAIALEAAGFAGLAWLVWVTVTAAFTNDWLYHGGFFLVAVASAVVIAASVQPTSRRLRALLSWRVLVGIGLISYGLYLYHVVVYMAVSPQRMGYGGVRLLLLRWAIAGAIAIASYFLIERPIRRRGIPKQWLRIGAPVTMVLVVVLLFVATAGGTPIPATAGTSYAYWSQATRPPKAVRVLVAGDGLATNLTRVIGNSYSGQGVRGTSAGEYACGISEKAVAIDAKIFPTKCSGWRDALDVATTAFSPQVAVIVLGPSVVFDRYSGGRYLRSGSPALAADLRADLDHAREVLTEHGARLMLATVPCMSPPLQPPSVFNSIERDTTRIAWLNSVWHGYVQQHPDVQLIDLHGFVCPGGATRRRINGGKISGVDGVTFNRAGALATWKYIAQVALSRPVPKADSPEAP